MEYNFTTPHGLKVRLNPRFFMRIIKNEDRFFTDEEMVADNTMYSTAQKIENIFQVSAALMFYFTIIACFCGIDKYIYALISAIIYFLGYGIRLSKQNAIAKILMPLLFVYNSIGIFSYVVLGIIFLFTKNLDIFLIFAGVKVVSGILSIILNNICAIHNYKKYGCMFNDIEICAFRTFQSNLRLSETLPELIEAYKKYN